MKKVGFYGSFAAEIMQQILLTYLYIYILVVLISRSANEYNGREG